MSPRPVVTISINLTAHSKPLITKADIELARCGRFWVCCIANDRQKMR